MPRRKLVLRIVLPLVTAAALAALAIAQSRRAPAPHDESLPAPPVHTRRTSFSIPFQVDLPSGSATAPTEVRLFLSTDQGQTWKLADRAGPERKSFSFRASRDGMYWFSLRTVDAAGRLHPSGPHSSGLRVSVDTHPPQLDLSAHQGSGGEIVVRWTVADDNLQSGSLKLSYRTTADSPWRPLAIDQSPTRKTTPGKDQGSAIWWPSRSSGTAAFRAEVADAAGNVTVARDQIQWPPSRANSNDRLPDTEPHSKEPHSKEPKPNLTAARPSALLPRVTSRPPSGPGRASQPWPVDKTIDVSMRRSLEGNIPLPPRDQAAVGSRPSNVRPSVQHDAENHSQDDRPRPYEKRLPPGERPYRVNSTSFNLRYDVQSVGPSGVGKVQLWETRDGGKTWQAGTIDRDLQSPVVAKVPRPGLYGFRVSVQNRRGQGGNAPRGGDLPEIWIAVDLDRPHVTIDQTRPLGDGSQSELEIRYQASDERLAARPVTLLFASAAQGPWTTIAAGLANTGSYRWRLDSRLPEQVYIRLEVRDAAKNVGVFQTAQPVSLRSDRPKARIQGVDPINPSAARPLGRRRRIR